MKIEHIGIAVKDLEASNELFKTLLGREHYKIEEVVSENVKTSFFQTGESKIELLEASNPNSAIAKFIEKRGEGIHHIAFEVEDIHAEMKRMEGEGFRLLNKEPKWNDRNLNLRILDEIFSILIPEISVLIFASNFLFSIPISFFTGSLLAPSFPVNKSHNCLMLSFIFPRKVIYSTCLFWFSGLSLIPQRGSILFGSVE